MRLSGVVFPEGQVPEASNEPNSRTRRDAVCQQTELVLRQSRPRQHQRDFINGAWQESLETEAGGLAIRHYDRLRPALTCDSSDFLLVKRSTRLG